MMLTSSAVPPHGGAEGIQHIGEVSDANAKKNQLGVWIVKSLRFFQQKTSVPAVNCFCLQR